MKTFSRQFLPETIEIGADVYKVNIELSHGMRMNNTPKKAISATLKKDGRRAILVKVLSRNLRGKTDLHGKPYQPSEWIYTTQKNNQ